MSKNCLVLCENPPSCPPPSPHTHSRNGSRNPKKSGSQGCGEVGGTVIICGLTWRTRSYALNIHYLFLWAWTSCRLKACICWEMFPGNWCLAHSISWKILKKVLRLFDVDCQKPESPQQSGRRWFIQTLLLDENTEAVRTAQHCV